MQQKKTNSQPKQLNKGAVARVVQLPARVTERLDDDYQSSKAAEAALDQLEADLKAGICSPRFALPRAFQLGAIYQAEVSERAARKAVAGS